MMSEGLCRVTPPNYSFTLERLTPFFPGKLLSDIQGQWGAGKTLSQKGASRVIRFTVSHMRYRFPVMVQVYGDQVTDLFTSLPTYFLHDIFHQSLINRYGKQDFYTRREEHALYEWQNRQGLTHSYAGTCTITCFPLYYSVSLASPPLRWPKYRTILQTIQEQEKQ